MGKIGVSGLIRLEQYGAEGFGMTTWGLVVGSLACCSMLAGRRIILQCCRVWEHIHTECIDVNNLTP